LKPELWADEKVGDMSRDARLLMLGLITMADDEGRLRAPRSAILGHVYPYDDDAATKLGRWIGEVERSEMIVCYQVGGKPYIAFRHWAKHQRVNRPSVSGLPAPPDACIVTDNSVIAHGGLTEDSLNDHGSLIPPRAGARSDPFLNEDESEETRASRSQIDRVFAAWVESTGRTNRTELDPKRRRLIVNALKSYPEADVIDAVCGWSCSPHHRGENQHGTVFNDLALLLRDAEHIEKFRDLTRGAGVGPLTSRELVALSNASPSVQAAIEDYYGKPAA
jgi:hypothetical protein